MEIDSVKTLQQLCITRIVICLWNQEDIKRLIESKLTIIFNENVKEWGKVEEKIVENIRKFSLPKAIENKFADFFRPIGLELLAWIEFHFMHLKLTPQIPGNIYWTSNGRIDLLQTAKLLIADPTLDIQDRYKLACAFCLEKSITELWKSMKRYRTKKDDYGLTIYWSYHNQGKTSKLKTKETLSYDVVIKVGAIARAFQWSVKSANIIGAKYFFEKLNAEERKRVLHILRTHLPLSIPQNDFKWENDFIWEKGYFLRRYGFDFLRFAFIDLTREQRTACIHYNENVIRNSKPFYKFQEKYLTGFLEWPFQELLLEEAESVWKFMPTRHTENYDYLLNQMKRKIIHGHNDYDYIWLFKTFWRSWPAHRSKKRSLDTWSMSRVKTDMYKFAQSNNITLIFKDWDLVDSFSVETYDGFFQDEEPPRDVGLLSYYILACLCHEEAMAKYVKYLKEKVSKIYNIKFPREDQGKHLDFRIGNWYDFFECLEEFMEHEEIEKTLVKKYNCPTKKEYLTHPARKIIRC